MLTRKTLTCILFSLCLGSLCNAQRIKGSDTLLPLTQELAEQYLLVNPEAEVIVTGGGSGVGIAALPENTTDIAMSSRRIKFSESMKFAQLGLDATELVVAFRGRITNWKEVGGEDCRIVVYSRETSSGTYEFFKESVLDNKNYMSSVLSMPATGAIIQSVRQTRGAIGYIGLAYLNRYVKALAVSYDGGLHYAYPSVGTAADGSYPVVRPLYYYYDSSKEATLRGFLDYALSETGQQLVLKEGFIPIAQEDDRQTSGK